MGEGGSMTEYDRDKFADLLAEVMAYYGKDTSMFMLSLWWDACKAMDYQQVVKALNAHAKDPDRGQFAPKVADVVRIVEGTATDRAQIAWGKALDAMQRVGAYQDVVFDDPVIHAAIVDLGGWVKLCRGDMSDLSYVQHRFCEAYRAYAGRDGFEYPKRLNGDRGADELYEKRGLPAPKPVVVGDVVKAREVYRLGGGPGRIATNVLKAIGVAA
jgi:Domain of unknown function (DUF6475)